PDPPNHATVENRYSGVAQPPSSASRTKAEEKRRKKTNNKKRKKQKPLGVSSFLLSFPFIYFILTQGGCMHGKEYKAHFSRFSFQKKKRIKSCAAHMVSMARHGK